MINPYIVIAHVPTPERRATLKKLEDRMDGLSGTVIIDHKREGSWTTFRKGILTVPSDVTHIALIPDDNLPCLNFKDTLVKVLEAKPDNQISLFTKNPGAYDALKHNLSWYTSLNGVVQVTMPRERMLDFVEFNDRYITNDDPHEYGEDTRATLYNMANGFIEWTVAASLLDHQPGPSLTGHDDHTWRRPAVPPFEDMSWINWKTDGFFVGRDVNLHWALSYLTDEGRRKYKIHERVFQLERHEDAPGRTVSMPARVRDR